MNNVKKRCCYGGLLTTKEQCVPCAAWGTHIVDLAAPAPVDAGTIDTHKFQELLGLYGRAWPDLAGVLERRAPLIAHIDQHVAAAVAEVREAYLNQTCRLLDAEAELAKLRTAAGVGEACAACGGRKVHEVENPDTGNIEEWPCGTCAATAPVSAAPAGDDERAKWQAFMDDSGPHGSSVPRWALHTATYRSAHRDGWMDRAAIPPSAGAPVSAAPADDDEWAKALEDARNVRRWIHDEVPAGTRATIGKLNRMDRVIAALTSAGAPVKMAYVATDLDGRFDVGRTPDEAKKRAGHGCDTLIPIYDIGSTAGAPADGQDFDRNAERLTREMGLGGGTINPNATSIDDLFLDQDESAGAPVSAALAAGQNAILITPQEAAAAGIECGDTACEGCMTGQPWCMHAAPSAGAPIASVPDVGAAEQALTPERRAAIHAKVLAEFAGGPDVVGPTVCTVPPPGWACTRVPGHDGPCAAIPADGQELPALPKHSAEFRGERLFDLYTLRQYARDALAMHQPQGETEWDREWREANDKARELNIAAKQAGKEG